MQRSAACGLVVLLLEGCAIHPIPQDVTGLPTALLTDYIRCEAVAAIEDKAIRLLRGYGQDGSVALADQLERNRGLFHKFNPRGLDQRERDFYNRYIESAIAFNFTFDITENNEVSAGVDFLKPLTGGVFSLGAGVSSQFSRRNERRYVVSDTFEELLNSDTLHCDGAYRPENFVYPISGKIGLDEVINAFVDLNEDEHLQATDKAQVFADTLTFTTVVGGTLNPKATFVTGGHSFQVLDAPFTSGSSRTDKHAVIIGLSLGSNTKDTSRKVLSGTAATGLVPQFLTSNNGSSTQRAVQATFDQRQNTYLDNAGR